MYVFSGHIPKEIAYIYAGTKKISKFLEGTELTVDEQKTTEVIPCLCTETDEKSILLGQAWARARAIEYDPETKQTKVTSEISVRKTTNEPIRNLRLLSPEIKGQKDVFKVVTPDGFYFSIGEDILLDILQEVGARPNGILNGEFLWAKIGSEMKLVRNQSSLFKALLEAGDRKLLLPIKNKNLKVGSIYETKRGEQGIFLGFVDSCDFQMKWESILEKYRKPPVITKILLKNQMLWFDIDKCMRNFSPQYLLAESLAKEELAPNFAIRKSHSMVKEIPGSVVVPVNLTARIREQQFAKFENLLKGFNTTTNRDLRIIALRNMRFALLREPGMSEPVLAHGFLKEIQQREGKIFLPISG